MLLKIVPSLPKIKCEKNKHYIALHLTFKKIGPVVVLGSIQKEYQKSLYVDWLDSCNRMMCKKWYSVANLTWSNDMVIPSNFYVWQAEI